MTLFLADESCEFAVVRRLRELHFDVEYIAETSPFGIILIRISDHERSRKIEQLELLAIKFADNLPHTVTTVTNNRIRFRSLFA